MDTSHARLTSITNPHRVAVRRDAIHAQIVSEPVPEHQRDTLVAGRVPGRPDLREHHEVLIVPYMTRFRDACGGVRCDLRSAGWKGDSARLLGPHTRSRHLRLRPLATMHGWAVDYAALATGAAAQAHASHESAGAAG